MGREGTCLLLEDLVLNLVLELLELLELGELELLFEEHLGGECSRSGVDTLERHQVGHGHEIVARGGEGMEGTLIWLLSVLCAVLVGVGEEEGEKVLLVVVLVHDAMAGHQKNGH